MLSGVEMVIITFRVKGKLKPDPSPNNTKTRQNEIQLSTWNLSSTYVG
jgi:hypothetical protein